LSIGIDPLTTKQVKIAGIAGPTRATPPRAWNAAKVVRNVLLFQRVDTVLKDGRDALAVSKNGEIGRDPASDRTVENPKIVQEGRKLIA
jgi:hypothetical protein